MRLCTLLLAILSLLATNSAGGDEPFPYTARVVQDDAYVRSGPGQDYYPTARLKQGDTVEVYRHDAGGWYAIRPPEGSFSWVSAGDLKVGNDRVGISTADQVVARIGSQFSEIRDVIQVRLKQGEAVEVLDPVDDGHHGADLQWYRVAPVAGEFRWVKGDHVQLLELPQSDAADNRPPRRDHQADELPSPGNEERNVERDGQRDNEANDHVVESRRAAAAPPRPIDESDGQADYLSETERDKPFRPLRQVSYTTTEKPHRPSDPRDVRDERKPSQADRSDDDRVRRNEVEQQAPAARPRGKGWLPPSRTRSAENLRDEDRPGRTQLRETSKRQPPADIASSPRPARPNRLALEIEALELSLSQMVAEEPTVWSFDRLRERAESALQDAQTADERGNVHLLLRKIDRFDQIGRQFRHVVMSQDDAQHSAPTTGVALGNERAGFEDRLADRGVSYSRAEPPPGGNHDRYDGFGWLTTVRSPRIELPDFALVDGQGDLLSYVTPVPGLNLRPYIGREIGITGNRGYLPELDARHLTARRVSVLGEARELSEQSRERRASR